MSLAVDKTGRILACHVSTRLREQSHCSFSILVSNNSENGSGMIAQWTSDALAEDPGLDPIVHVGPFTAACDSSSRGSDQMCLISAGTSLSCTYPHKNTHHIKLN